MVKAAKEANAHEFIMELDEGYETRIGEKGTKILAIRKFITKSIIGPFLLPLHL